jgi:hypothetical protein
MIALPFVVFADIDQVELLAAVLPGFDLIDSQLSDARLGVLDQLEKPW